MTEAQLINRLEALGYLYVTVTHVGDAHSELSAIDPAGYQIEIKREHDGELVVDRKRGSEIWDIMFIGKESYL